MAFNFKLFPGAPAAVSDAMKKTMAEWQAKAEIKAARALEEQGGGIEATAVVESAASASMDVKDDKPKQWQTKLSGAGIKLARKEASIPDKIRIEVKEGDAETRNKTFREFEMLRFLDSEMEDVVCPEATITRYMNLKGDNERKLDFPRCKKFSREYEPETFDPMLVVNWTRCVLESQSELGVLRVPATLMRGIFAGMVHSSCDAETKSAFYNLAIYLGKHNLFDQEALTNGDIPAQFMLALDTTYFAKDEDRMQDLVRFAHVLVWLVHSEAKSMEKKLQQTPCIGDVAVDEHQCTIMIANITRILDKESKLKWPPKSLLISSSEAVIVKEVPEKKDEEDVQLWQDEPAPAEKKKEPGMSPKGVFEYLLAELSAVLKYPGAFSMLAKNRDYSIDGYHIGWCFRNNFRDVQLITGDTLRTNPNVLASVTEMLADQGFVLMKEEALEQLLGQVGGGKESKSDNSDKSEKSEKSEGNTTAAGGSRRSSRKRKAAAFYHKEQTQPRQRPSKRARRPSLGETEQSSSSHSAMDASA